MNSFLKRKAFPLLGAMCAAAAALPAVPAHAQGDLLVAPTRVILDGRRGTEVILSNIGQEEATYRISLELRRMNEDGSLTPVEREQANALEEAALGMIRYAPRRITLPPGQPQAVRIGARPGAELADGEYRVHMSFRAVPKPRRVTEQASQAEGIQIRLIPVYGVTIPIIVRHGRLEAQVAIENPRVDTDAEGRKLVFGLQRNGESSTYGELRVIRQGEDTPAYVARGIAVYSEIDSRSVELRLTDEQAAALTGPVRVEYREMPENGGELIASVETVFG